MVNPGRISHSVLRPAAMCPRYELVSMRHEENISLSKYETLSTSDAPFAGAGLVPRRVAAAVPAAAGVGLKPEHYRDVLEPAASPHQSAQCQHAIEWFEVHPENYMGAGGPPHAYLTAVRERFPLSLHGVGLSIGSSARPDPGHLARLKELISRYQPGLFSEHLAWSSHTDGFLDDLLPLPYTPETLGLICEHIDEVQTYLGRQMLLENPATYLTFAESTIDEIDFLGAIADRTGCGLLLDVNNVYVASINHRHSPGDYIDAFPMCHVGEIHLAGHDEESGDAGDRLLIDTHDRAVIGEVWRLYERAIGLAGPVPTLIEWDNNIPDWQTLAREAGLAGSVLRRAILPAKAAVQHLDLERSAP